MSNVNNKNSIAEKQLDKSTVVFDKRELKRTTAKLEISLSGPHNFFNGFTEDISDGGVFVATHQLFPIGTEMLLTLTLEGKEIEIVADVVWLRDYNDFNSLDNEPGMGLKFRNLSEENKIIINKFIKKREPLFFDTDE
jgi:uncharacterized protein (TIGR02266 family)